MHYLKQTFLVSFFLFSFFCNDAKSQQAYIIPAFTGYSVPLDNANNIDGSSMFTKEGLSHWKNKNLQVDYYFYLRNKGSLSLSLNIKNESAGNEIRVKIADKAFVVTVPQSDKYQKLIIGTVDINQPGFYSVELQGVKKTGKTIAEIQSLNLEGSATKDMHFNSKPRRNAASVHLMYPVADSIHVTGFYNEITVPKNADQLYSYFMACGFSRGYFGMQVNSAVERRIIFSVWDAGNEAIDRNKVSEENKVQLNGKGENVIAEGFGNEGTGGHSHFVYNWKPGETYRFYETALPDSATNSTIYSGYFFIPETQKWKLIASFKSPKDGKYLRGLYSFLENFGGANGNLFRKAAYSNQWIKTENGEWKELTNAKFSCDATGRALDRIDFGGAVENNSFYLWNGGFQATNTDYGTEFKRQPNGQKPNVDLYKNADSLIEAEKENKEIFDSIAAGKLDTTASYNGLYYQIIKEGNGDYVSVSDTLTVNYKGMLVNGTVFDESRENPATFPLNRLIKGWQIGLTKCKKGGKIRLIIPSALAYSIRARADKIPPNSILIFDVEVLDIKK